MLLTPENGCNVDIFKFGLSNFGLLRCTSVTILHEQKQQTGKKKSYDYEIKPFLIVIG